MQQFEVATWGKRPDLIKVFHASSYGRFMVDTEQSQENETL